MLNKPLLESLPRDETLARLSILRRSSSSADALRSCARTFFASVSLRFSARGGQVRSSSRASFAGPVSPLPRPNGSGTRVSPTEPLNREDLRKAYPRKQNKQPKQTKQTHKPTDKQTNERTDKRTNERTNKRNEQTKKRTKTKRNKRIVSNMT